jgi:pimeloyl-ACP methyl ester carboxylesterase
MALVVPVIVMKLLICATAFFMVHCISPIRKRQVAALRFTKALRGLLTTSLLIGFPPQISLAASDASTTPVTFIFCAGFLLPSKCYRNWQNALTEAFPLSQVIFIEDQSTLQSSLTIEESVKSVERIVSTINGDVVLLGHSRGGATACWAILEGPTKVKAAVLIDPVDTADEALLSRLRSDSINEVSLNVPCLLFSTPYGGKSSYYKSAIFTSSCAPAERNAEAIYTAIRQVNRARCGIIRMEEMGHFQLLDDEGMATVAIRNACPANTAPIKPLQIYRQEALRTTVAFLVSILTES